MTVSEANETLRDAMLADPSFAWSWQCNIAMCACDKGFDAIGANKAARSFIRLLFEIDVVDHETVKDVRLTQP